MNMMIPMILRSLSMLANLQGQAKYSVYMNKIADAIEAGREVGDEAELVNTLLTQRHATGDTLTDEDYDDLIARIDAI